MQNGTMRLRRVGAWLAGAAVLGACDAPTEPATTAGAGGPSMLITPACAGTGGQAHTGGVITTAQTWTRANSPHRVSGTIYVEGAGRLTIAPGAVVCFSPYTGVRVQNGGRITARGRDTAQVVLTARDAAWGWQGVHLSGSPAGPSYLTNVRMEHVSVDYAAVSSMDQHAAYVDSAVIRQSGRGVLFMAPGSRLIRSRVDTTTARGWPAVHLVAGSMESSIVRRSAGPGVRVTGTGVLLLGGRIEGSAETGLRVEAEPLSTYSRAVRVTGGQGYPADLPLPVLARLYSTAALQDSLSGNARDTVQVGGGTLRSTVTAGSRVALRFGGEVTVDSAGTLVAQPGARLVFVRYAGIVATRGGRLLARGSAASPVRLTADDPAVGWNGMVFSGTGTGTSYLTNTRVEHTSPGYRAVTAAGSHRVIVDSAVFRRTGGISLMSPNSRVSRTRVDTTFASSAAVQLAANARIESTRILAADGAGLAILSPTVQVMSCDIRDSEGDGIFMLEATPIRNCNLVNNAGAGIYSLDGGDVLATGLWWGGTGGPDGPGGDGVWGFVTYSPWRTAPYVMPYIP